MNKRTCVAALSLTAAFLLSACGINFGTGGTSSGSTSLALTSPESTVHNEIVIKKTPTYAGVYSSNGTPELDLFYEQVQVSNPTAQAELQQLIDEKLNLPAEQETDRLREEYLDADNKSYFEQVLLDSRADEQLVSLLVRITTYREGSAHSNYNYRGLTVSAQTGETLTLADLGVDEEKAIEILTTGLMEAYNRQEGVRPFEVDGHEDDLTTLLGNFYLGTHEVIFLCNPYRFGQPFSAGAFRFCVPYDQLGVAEQYRPEHTISEACIQDMYGARFYADGTKSEGAGEMTEKLNETHSIVLNYEMIGLIRKD